MSHEVETMAYAGELPWHGLGVKVLPDLTPDQMLEKAGLDWTVEKSPGYAIVNGEPVFIGRSALVRSKDQKILDIVSDDWNPVQNQEAFDFFNEFVMAGDMEMHTAGSLRGGQVVWALAKIKESFDLFGGDQVDAYLLFSNFHKYGHSTDVRFTPIRVVCNNTLTLSLNTAVERMAKFSHRKAFDPEVAKEAVGISTEKLQKYKEMASFLGSKMAKGEDIITYFQRVFPLQNQEEKADQLSKNAQTALDILHTQPGAEYAEGSWWQPFNAVTYMTDHITGRSNDTRLSSAWYGPNKNTKTRALETAIEMAEAA